MRSTLLAVVFVSTVAPLCAQQPAGVPQVVTIIRETVKEGKGRAHERAEKAYADVFRKNKFPFHYMGMSASAGPNEVWFINTYPSFAAIEEADKLTNSEPLKQQIEAVEARDGEFRVRSQTITAIFRGDLSYLPAKMPALGKSRYVMISSYRLRLGREEEFMAGGKMILDAEKKANFEEPVFTFQVVAGAP